MSPHPPLRRIPGVYYINEASGVTTPDHPLLSTLTLTVVARKRVFEEDEQRRRRQQTMGIHPTGSALSTNPAGRPNQQRHSSDADIFGTFFEAPETADTINLPRRGAQSDGPEQPPIFAPVDVEAELDYFLNEPSPPAARKA